jgi:hypothetical protein
MASDKLADFTADLTRLMDRYRVDGPTVRAILRGRKRRTRAKSFTEDFVAALIIALMAEGARHALQGFKNGTRFEEYEVEKIKPCTAARLVAECVRGNSIPSTIERLRKEFRRREEYYRSSARTCAAMIEIAYTWRQRTFCKPDAEKLSLCNRIADVAAKNPLIQEYILQVALPELSAYREELRARAREVAGEIAALVQRREELGIIRDWHLLARWVGLAVSPGTGKKQLQEAINGIKTLRLSA